MPQRPQKPEASQFEPKLPQWRRKLIEMVVGKEEAYWNKRYRDAITAYNALYSRVLNQEREYAKNIQPKIDLANKRRERHLRAQVRRAAAEQSNAKRYKEVIELWNADRERWSAVAAADHLRFQLLRRQYISGESVAVERIISIALSRTPCPAGFPLSFTVLYDATNKILALDYLLPNLEEMTVLKPRGEKQVVVGKIEQARLENTVPIAVAIGVIYECVLVDYAKLISSVA